MKQLSSITMLIIERVYDSQEECDSDIITMKEMGFQATPDSHDIYEFFMRYAKKNQRVR